MIKPLGFATAIVITTAAAAQPQTRFYDVPAVFAKSWRRGLSRRQ
jgi:hypothetical protein